MLALARSRACRPVLRLFGALVILLVACAIAPLSASAVAPQLPESPVSLAVNASNHRVYAVNFYAGTVSVVDTATGSVVSLTVGDGPRSIVVDAVANKALVANYYSNTVSVIDCSSNAVSSYAVGSYPCALALDAATHKAYVANAGSTFMSVLDLMSSSVTSITLPAKQTRVAVDSSTHRVFASLPDKSAVAVVDAATSNIATVAVAASPSAIAVNRTTGKAYVANYDSGSVSVIDGATHASYSVLVGVNPSDIAIDETRNKVYVANAGSNSISVIDGSTSAVTNIAVGSNPIAVQVDPTLNEICTLNADSSSVSIINGGTLSVGNVTLKGSPSVFAVEPAFHTAYVATTTWDEDSGDSLASLETVPLNGLIVPSSARVYVGSKTTLKFVGGSGSVTWSTSSGTVAKVAGGVVYGLKAGKATITAKRNGVRSTCVVTVVKRSYSISLTRSVSSGRGYINVSAKTVSGAVVKNHTVKFYRNGTYLGKATTDSHGKAHLRVSKNLAYRTYKVTVSGDSRYNTTAKQAELRFCYVVYDYSGTDIWYDSVYLPVGNYRMVVYGDGNVYGCVGIIEVDGSSGDWADFRVLKNYTFSVEGISSEYEGQVEVVLYRLM